MQKEIRTVCYDDDCHLEAYRFEGIVQYVYRIVACRIQTH